MLTRIAEASLAVSGLAAGVLLLGGLWLRSWRRGHHLRSRMVLLETELRTVHQALQDQHRARQELTDRAMHDPLTGLANRTAFLDRLDQELPEASVLLLDLDDFGPLNDALGASAGDDIMIEVARRLRGVARHMDTVARLGSDTLALLLPHASRQRAQLTAVRVLDALRPLYHVQDRRIELTTSVGMLVVSDQQTGSAALRDADLALSAAKAAGKNRLVEFTPELREERVQQARLAAGLRQAMDRDELLLHYQPIVTLDGERPIGLEALARWRPSGAAAIPPSQFIPVAEQTGLVVALGARVLREACAQARGWHEKYGTTVSVNISSHQLVERDFADLVLAILGETGLPGSALVLEITESVLISSHGPVSEQVVGRLERLREHGVTVAVDDFGTGYSSLAYLHRLPIDMIKVDGEFIRALGASRGGEPATDRGTIFAQTILALGASLQLRTVAEGVETQQQADALRALRCPLAQGFWFASPAPPEEIEEYLARRCRQRVPA